MPGPSDPSPPSPDALNTASANLEAAAKQLETSSSAAASSLDAAAKQIETSSANAATNLTAAAKQIETSTANAAASLTEAAKQVEAAVEAAAAKLLVDSTITSLEPPPIELPKLDEYVEDLIDPSFGGYSSRAIASAAADKILAGFNGLLYRKPEPPK
jgi:hypothetical protein